MKKIVVLVLPFLLITPVFFIINIFTSWGFDFVFPDFYSFYPFPTEICNPQCGRFTLGLIASICYWFISYLLYFKYIKKNNYTFGNAILFCVLFCVSLGVITFILLIISSLYFSFISGHYNLKNYTVPKVGM